MPHHGSSTKIVSAYATLATVALGLVVLDPVHRSDQAHASNSQAPTLALQSPSTTTDAAHKPAIGATLPKTETATASGSAKNATIATYTSLRPAK